MVHGGHSHVSLYADTTGQLHSVDGIEDLPSYPGNPDWTPSKSVGDQIPDTNSYRARIGNVYATASTAALAQDRAVAASQAIRADIR